MRGKKNIIPLQEFSKTVFKLQKSDRDVNLACSGFTGEGKSTFITKLQKEVSGIAKVPWDFDKMTWSRKELMTWIDGEKGSEKDENGLKKGQLPEFSSIIADELIGMFFNREWYESEQIDAVKTFNMCRDRHLFIAGAAPNFWDLDSPIRGRFRFYAYIPFRGIAWIFEQENNPFTKDPWNVTENMKLFRKYKNPYNCTNYLGEIHFPDWSEHEKERYLEIRNSKRVTSIDENKSQKKESYSRIKKQRDSIVKMLYNAEFECKHCHGKNDKLFTLTEMADIMGLTKQTLSMVINGD